MNLHPHSRRGSVLMVTLILGLILATLALSYVSLSFTTMRNASRSFEFNTAFDAAEAGLEEALWALNYKDWTQRNWTGGEQTKTFVGSGSNPAFTDANGVRSFFKVRVENIAAGTPTITAEGVVLTKAGSAIRKQLRVDARNASRYMPPFTAVSKLTLNGGEIDSYRMADGNYTVAPRTYNTTVASPTINYSNISVGSPADIYGYVTVGVGTDHAQEFIDSIKGSVVGPSTASGQPGVEQAGSNLIDTNRVAFDFTQDFPVYTPEGAFPDAWPAGDPVTKMIVLGDATGGTKKRYTAPSNYSVPNGYTVLIVGEVEIKTIGSFTVGGQAAFTVLEGSFTTEPTKSGKTTTPGVPYTAHANAKATIYAYGDLSVSGNGALTGGTVPGTNISTDPRKLEIKGVATGAQKISVGGNGNLAAAIDAPAASVTFNGGGSSGYFAGAVVANEITVNGNGYKIRFPEEMANFGASSTFQVSRWIELTDRNDWTTF